jgi:catechol 2,3-dioxygenase-like lactoylglutathione lyase family enzyme
MAEVALDVVVLRSADMSAARAFYEAVGLTFVAEKHGSGPDHLAATLAGGVVLELYPAQIQDCRCQAVVVDPDGRRVELTSPA